MAVSREEAIEAKIGELGFVLMRHCKMSDRTKEILEITEELVALKNGQVPDGEIEKMVVRPPGKRDNDLL